MFFIKRKQKNTQQKGSLLKREGGFSLIETLVATTVLIFVITGPLTLIHQSLTLIKKSKSRVIATYLAQDAIEYIRNKRDDNILSGVAWTKGISSCISKDGSRKCTVDTVGKRSPAIQVCGAKCVNLKYEESTSLYNYANGIETDFKREVSLKSINSDEIAVLVKVSWGGGVLGGSITTKDNFLNWFQY